MKKVILFLLLGWFPTMYLVSQESPIEKLKIFIEGKSIDFNYMRNNTTFVDFVNDPKVCEVHVIINKQKTGGGGSLFSFEFYGIEFPKIPVLKLSCYTLSYDTNESIRIKQLKTLHSGLLPYINEKNGLANLSVINTFEKLKYNIEEFKSESADPWRQWVFRISADIGFEGEERKRNLEYKLSARVVKVTDSWKISNEYEYEKSEETIEKDNGETIRSLKIDQDADVKLVFSMNPHWSYGLFLEGSQSTYRNVKMDLKVAPALQYNIYNWNESDKRQFTFSYYLGPTYYKYYETTILNKTNEWLWEQSFGIGLNRIETWGEVDVWIEGGHYFPDINNYYIETGIDVSLRISKGLSIYFEIQAESIHNQIYLPVSELSDEELLLNTRKLPSTYEYSGRVGLRFQFGSIYNNVVNERF